MSNDVLLLLSPILTGIILAIGDRIIKRSDTTRAARKDLREEIAELWDRIDEQDKKIELQGKTILEKDTQIVALIKRVEELDTYRAKYANTAIENEDLRRQLRDYDNLKRRIALLERELHEFKAGGA